MFVFGLGQGPAVVTKNYGLLGMAALPLYQSHGVASDEYLQRFPVDFIKIDKSFLADITDGDAIITRAIIALGHNLKLKVIAEGVETRAQLDFLRDYDCDQMQGYYFSPAVGAAALDDMLARDMRLALPERCTTARTCASSWPSATEAPSTPSRPTEPTSSVMRPSATASSEIRQSPGK